MTKLTLPQAKEYAQDFVTVSNELHTAFGHLPYKSDRSALRAAFCESALTEGQVDEWLDDDDDDFSSVILPLCMEWLKKIATPGSGVTRNNPSRAGTELFKIKANSFYEKYKEQMSSPLVKKLDGIKDALRAYVMAELQQGVSSEALIERLEITDPTLKERITGEWAMKAKSAAFNPDQRPAKCTALLFNCNKRTVINVVAVAVASVAMVYGATASVAATRHRLGD